MNTPKHYEHMSKKQREEYWVNAFKRGFANTNVTLTQVEFLDLIPEEMKSRQAHPTHKQGETK